MTPAEALPPALARHYRRARVVLVVQAVLLLVAAALQPIMVRRMLVRPPPGFGPAVHSGFMMGWMYAGAVVVAVMYAALAALGIVAAASMSKRTTWGWVTALIACFVALSAACMPFGIYVVYVLLQPGVRAAMSPPAAGEPS